MVNTVNYFRYTGKDIPSQNLKHNQLVIKIGESNDKVKFINQRTGRTQYFKEKLWDKYFILSVDKYHI